ELIPQGKLWRGKNILTLFKALEDAIRRVHDEANKLLVECIPSTSNALLSDWMRICDVKTKEGMLSTLRAVGGNTDSFFELVAREFDKDCQILRNNPQAQFMAGIACAGMGLGAQSIPKFCVVFQFSVEESIAEAEILLNKLKPAHVKFIYIYKNLKMKPFIAGRSCAGDSLNFYEDL
ncbi:MAG: hypothetical protein V4591_03205, partial [Bdellovibrionota bacterium]